MIKSVGFCVGLLSQLRCQRRAKYGTTKITRPRKGRTFLLFSLLLGIARSPLGEDDRLTKGSRAEGRREKTEKYEEERSEWFAVVVQALLAICWSPMPLSLAICNLFLWKHHDRK